ncbi:MAG: ABC transporter permease subunit [Gammaproteobacteria bacterium]|nr:ABC transporter permease subunit [Gammaproteobacteria bacterium]
MNNGRSSRTLLSFLVFGFAFLYVPILLLVVYSFNESRMVTIWGGFSTKWYGALLQDQAMLDAAWKSLRLAFTTACTSLVIGTTAGLALTRFGRFRGKSLLGGLITAPMVMPEVITGLALLLLFVTMEQIFGWPAGRGMTTLWIAHVTFTSSYVAIIIASRLRELDVSIEEAALDLGATPFKVFFLITLPIIAPAMMSGWLLAFTISLDDLVISSFVSGPSSTTLPMVVFSSVRLGLSPKINALATIIVSLVSAGVILSGIVMMRQEKKRQKEIAQAIEDAKRQEAVGAA